ncbi:MAG: hypothetical protein JRF59_12855 [Deltaproteobacteria bacterium]|nr:hypothetical protein [Deltaproteobacteria bacterium]MBW1924159.1 hypothetical protein [Deltaproteobacteria bacterium]MBW1949928.1 hypothetical protein [Deltaproteobacteria bacterium]MBW2008459.1 hypothetical protein [Deltaproteobacteria bacterium]MBW2102222.1 hypothetical protein [Deltaproteobacteria bacterium]
MLRIRPIMNSAVEEIFAFKVCCGPKAFDQNLEILITNEGDLPVEVQSRFDLRSGSQIHRFDTLMPHGLQRIEPGRVIAFYCNMDEVLWEKSEELIFYDREGNAYPARIT